MVYQEELTAPGPMGLLKGTLTLPSEHGPLPNKTPVFLIVPGSGPTDRDGNSPLGIAAAPYRLLAEALAKRGYPSVRIDKRGMFGSEGASFQGQLPLGYHQLVAMIESVFASHCRLQDDRVEQ